MRVGGAIHIGIVLIALAAMIGYNLASSRPVAVEVLSIAVIVAVLAQALVVSWQRSRSMTMTTYLREDE
jgi:hypothetical protein